MQAVLSMNFTSHIVSGGGDVKRNGDGVREGGDVGRRHFSQGAIIHAATTNTGQQQADGRKQSPRIRNALIHMVPMQWMWRKHTKGSLSGSTPPSY